MITPEGDFYYEIIEKNNNAKKYKKIMKRRIVGDIRFRKDGGTHSF